MKTNKPRVLDRRGIEDGVCEVEYVDAAQVKAAKAGLPDSKLLLSAADALKTVGHPNRLRILEALDGRELCVCDLTQVLGVSMSATSQHLRDLRQLGAVEFRVDGKLVYYSIANRFWLELGRQVAEQLSHPEANRVSPKKRRVAVGLT